MNWHELVFSDDQQQRNRRHAIFWLSWWLYFVLTFFYTQQGLQSIGSLKWFAIVTIKSFTILLSHAFIVYTIIYVLIPHLFLTEKYVAFIFTVLVAGAIIIAWAYFCYAIIYPQLDSAFRLSTVITKNILFWSSMTAGLISAIKVATAAISIKFFKRWLLKQEEKDQLEKERTIAELKLLKGQIHPDFLFNSLDNIYSFAESNPPDASDSLLRLSEMLSYMLYECDEQFVSLEKEIKMVRNYVSLEKIRMGPKLEIDIAIKGKLLGKTIVPLLLLPFIENAFSFSKYEKLDRFWINIDLIITQTDLTLKLINGVSTSNFLVAKEAESRLDNVRRRLQIVYPDRHKLKTIIGDEMIMTLLNIKWQTEGLVRKEVVGI